MIDYVEWCNSNRLRSFPVSEAASVTDDRGVVLDDAVVVDAGLSVSQEWGRPWISGIRITPAVVVVSICADSGPLGVVARSRSEVVAYEPTAVTALVDGFSGWITLGELEPGFVCAHKFSGPSQSIFEDRVVTTMPGPGVTSIRKFGANSVSLTGDVTIRGGSGVSVEASAYDNAIVLTLDADRAESFIGPCASSISGGRCGFAPIRRISGVSADDTGTLTLRFRSQ